MGLRDTTKGDTNLLPVSFGCPLVVDMLLACAVLRRNPLLGARIATGQRSNRVLGRQPSQATSRDGQNSIQITKNTYTLL